MPSKSKTKGSSWERDLSKFLTEVYGEPFIRIPTSGAWVGGKNAHRKDTLQEAQIMSRKGDIQPPDDWKWFNCEAKSYADFRFHHLFTGCNKTLDQWIQQMYNVADEHDFNIIFMKFNNKGKWVAYEAKHSDIDVKHGVLYKDWIFCSWDEFWGSEHNRQYVEGQCKNLNV